MKHRHVCCLSIILGSTPVAAQSYVVGVEALAFAPHYSVDKQGNYQGFTRELLDLFAVNSGVELVYRPLPVNQLLPALLEGQVDFKYPDSELWAQEQKAGKSLIYSSPVVDYVDGVLVAPSRVGQPVSALKRLSIVEGWTPWAYEQQVENQQVKLSYSADLRKMIQQALKKDTDGAYFNIVVATHYLDNIRARPGALVFDPKLPHTRGSFHLSTIKHPELIQRFDRFLAEHSAEVAALKNKYQVEANLDSEFMGMEQWKVDFLKRQKAKAAAGG
ncbi:transporter substrate-binding domain-containing protein [Pseudomonas sp. NPDC078700]|uniref:transporter substrate-binding domain-containing protein n=1 Tax=Pseudomonas sp. NPDC078700 TaxID=3364424 RepID=UPI0037C56A01